MKGLDALQDAGAAALRRSMLNRWRRRFKARLRATRLSAAYGRPNLAAFRRGYRFGGSLPHARPSEQTGLEASRPGRLETFYDAYEEGPGIWKFRHYLPIYERHFAKFVGTSAHVLEIGVYGGGSLSMWKDYFGERATIYGIDIRPESRAFDSPRTRIFIGDQADPGFWRRFVAEVPDLDVVIDDGGHLYEQQVTSLEWLLPHLRPGGVYLCEDIHHPLNPFHAYLDGLGRRIHVVKGFSAPRATQEHIASVHRYPSLIVIEKPSLPVAAFEAVKRGTEWPSG